MSYEPDAPSEGPKPSEGSPLASRLVSRISDGADRHSPPADVKFEQAVARTDMAFCLCDPYRDDFPIVFANRAFCSLTGYDQQEVVGRNCRFMQGPETDPREVEKIRAALRDESVVLVELLNYRKDGSAFWNALHLAPVYDEQGVLTYFCGSHWDASAVRAARAEQRQARVVARELSHRMKNMFAVISGIVNITGRVRGIPVHAAEINSRIQALGRAYETTLDEASSGSIEIGPAIRAILSPYEAGQSRLRFLGDGLRVHFATVSVVGLVLHELAANAMRFGAWSRDGGRVELDWGALPGQDPEAEPGGLVVHWREVGGPTILAPPVAGGTGTQIVDRMLRHGGGSIERHWNADGLEARIVIRA